MENEEKLYALEMTTRMNIRNVPLRIKAAIQSEAIKGKSKDSTWNMEKEVVDTLTLVYGPIADEMERTGKMLERKPVEG